MTVTAPQGWHGHGLCGAPNPPGLPCFSDSGESACDARDLGLIPRSGRSPGEGNGYSLQYSCLDNSTKRSLVGYSPRGHRESDTTEQLILPALRCSSQRRRLPAGTDPARLPDRAPLPGLSPLLLQAHQRPQLSLRVSAQTS